MSSSGYIDTYYLRTIDAEKPYPFLRGEEEADVCVIGGGLAGLNTALGLAERGKSVVLAEAKRIGWGASGRNGGYVAKGYAAGAGALAKKLGLEKARELMALSRAARQTIRKRIRDYNIDCDLVDSGVLTVSLKSEAESLRRHVDEMNESFDAGYVFWPKEKVRQHCRTEKYFDGILSVHDFQFNPLRFVHGLARTVTEKGGKVFENTPAMSISRDGAGGWTVTAPEGRVRARQVVLCCSIHVNGLDKRLARAAFPVQAYVMTTQPVAPDILKSAIDTPYALYDTRFSSDFYRLLPENRILWGGRVGLWAEPRDIAEAMLHDMFRIYPQLKGHVRPDTAWSGLMCYAPHKMPQIGEIEPGYWYNTGYGGHGLTPTTAGGEAVAAAIAEGDLTYRKFAPFGLSYAGGRLGRYAAQMIYWWWRALDLTKV